MALPARFSLLHSELNDFLFASIGEAQNGMPLSVASALTQLGLDPWKEAARLAVMPKALAAAALAPIVARLPIDRPRASDDMAVSLRLVELLPIKQQPASLGPGPASANDKRYFQVTVLLACLALGAAVLFSML